MADTSQKTILQAVYDFKIHGGPIQVKFGWNSTPIIQRMPAVAESWLVPVCVEKGLTEDQIRSGIGFLLEQGALKEIFVKPKTVGAALAFGGLGQYSVYQITPEGVALLTGRKIPKAKQDKRRGPSFNCGNAWSDLTFIVDSDAEELTIKSGNHTQRAGLRASGFSATMIIDLCVLAEGCGSYEIARARALEAKPGKNPLETLRAKSNHEGNVRVRLSRLNEKIQAMFPHLKGKAIARGKTQFRIETLQNNELDSLMRESELDRRGLLRF